MLDENIVSDNTDDLSSLLMAASLLMFLRQQKQEQGDQRNRLLVLMTLMTISKNGMTLMVTSMISSAVVHQHI
jgi:hypothetical protein